MKRLNIFLILTGFTLGTIAAVDLKCKLTGSYFMPSEQAFRDIYGGGLIFGVEAFCPIRNQIEAWLNLGFFSKKGEMTFTGEEIKLNILPITVGARYIYPLNEKISLYGGLGLGYFRYSEKIAPLEDISGGSLGIVFKTGARLKLAGKLFSEIAFDYSLTKAGPADFDVGLGGLSFGVGIGCQFSLF